MGNYDARARSLETQLNDWYVEYQSGDLAAADSIENLIIQQGLMTSAEFNRDVTSQTTGHSGNSWLDYSADLSDRVINREINQDIRDQIAELGTDGFFDTEGTAGQQAKQLEEELAAAQSSTNDPIISAAILAQQVDLIDVTGIEGFDLAAVSRGEINTWDYESEPENAARKRWGSQCFLSAQMDKLADLHPVNFPAEPGYKRVHMLGGAKGDEGQARVLVNKLHARKDMSEFVEVTPSEMSQLVPKIEISKVVYDDKLRYVDEVRLPFPAHSLFKADSDVLESARTDYGITGVSWAFQGVQPDAIKNDIVSRITFYFQGFDPLVKKHVDFGKGGTEVEWSYLDLLGFGRSVVTPEDLAKGRSFDDTHHYEVRLKAGYNLASSTFDDTTDANVRRSLRDAVQAQNTNLYLILVDHTINVNDTGTIVITCDFRGRLENLLTDAKADVLATTQYKTELDKISENIEDLRSRKTPNQTAMVELQQRYNSTLDRIRVQRLNAIIDRLEQKENIYNILASARTLGGFTSGGYTGDIQLPNPQINRGTDYGFIDQVT